MVNSGTVTIDNTNETGEHICYTTESSQTPQCGTTAGTCNVGSLNSASFSYDAANSYKAITCRTGAASSTVSEYVDYSSPCATLKSAGNTTSGVYSVNGLGNVYCDMTTEGGGWTLFAITSASNCAEALPYGTNALNISDSPYFTTLLKDTNHEFLQIMKKDG